MELELEHRSAHGSFFNVNYTFGKTLAHDATSRIRCKTASWTMDRIPSAPTNGPLQLYLGPTLGQGKAGLKTSGPVVSRVVSNWKLSGDLYVRRQQQFTVTAPAAQSGTGPPLKSELRGKFGAAFGTQQERHLSSSPSILQRSPYRRSERSGPAE
jgi:hypothetical protein